MGFKILVEHPSRASVEGKEGVSKVLFLQSGRNKGVRLL